MQHFPQIGFALSVIQPGQPSGMYHAESNQEDFLVLAGECVLVVEGEERLLRAWDFVHCPPGTEHVFVGAGDSPCVIFMTGARTGERQIVYPRSEPAFRHGAGVETETTSAAEAYERFPHWQPERPGPGCLERVAVGSGYLTSAWCAFTSTTTCVIGTAKRSRAFSTTPCSSQCDRPSGCVDMITSSGPKVRSASSIAWIGSASPTSPRAGDSRCAELRQAVVEALARLQSRPVLVRGEVLERRRLRRARRPARSAGNPRPCA